MNQKILDKIAEIFKGENRVLSKEDLTNLIIEAYTAGTNDCLDLMKKKLVTNNNKEVQDGRAS